MKHTLALAFAFALSIMSASAWAATDDEHKGHHPAGAASGTAAKAAPAKPNVDMMRMDTQMGSMREMHNKLVAAKSPDERKALMAEHMKTMQDSMTMMNGMSLGGMGGMGGMKGEMKGGMKGDMTAHHQMMDKRMEMMQSMMQMMMDRMSAAPSN